MKWIPRESGEARDPEARGFLSPGAASLTRATSESSDFVQVYTEHFDFACRSLRLLGVSADALEDAAQDVFGVVHRRLPEFAGNSSLKTWIYSIVQRVAANHRRTRRRKQRQLRSMLDEPPAPTGSPEAEAEALQAAARIQAFCDGLDESKRTLLVLSLFEDVPARELATMLGVPLFTVYSRIRNLRAELERFLKSNEASRSEE